MLTLKETSTPLQGYFEKLLELDDIRTKATRTVGAAFELRADITMTPNLMGSIVVMTIRATTTELREAVESFARWLVGGNYPSNWPASWNRELFEPTEAMSALINDVPGFNKLRPEVTDQVAMSFDLEDLEYWALNFDPFKRLEEQSERLPMGSDELQLNLLKQWMFFRYEPGFEFLEATFANPSLSVWKEFLSDNLVANGGYGTMNEKTAVSDLLSMGYTNKSRLDAVQGVRLNFNLRYMDLFEYSIDVDHSVPVRVVIDQATASKEATKALVKAYIERRGNIRWATIEDECFADFWRLFVRRHYRQLQDAGLSTDLPEVDMISGPYWFVEAIN